MLARNAIAGAIALALQPFADFDELRHGFWRRPLATTMAELAGKGWLGRADKEDADEGDESSTRVA